MTIIRILPEILSNKIAAGEVVERPASVVKELLENSLDAESTQIVVEIEKGGRSLIRVSDNGIGMRPDDALLSIERYATSKIYKNEDLFSIRTLGFRGEALPSIASVSRFSLVTRHRETDTGLEVLMAGGKIEKVTECGAPVGTQVTVRQLFFNTPARRKFLKGVQTETGHIADVVTAMALGRPAVQFKLLHNKKTVKNWVAVANPADRVIHVLGSELKAGIISVQHDDGYLQLEGWLSSPSITRKTSRSMHIYVNGRAARDRVIQHALFEGYAGRLVKGQFPMAVLFVRLPFDRVDVNVHPAKNEVRFSDQKLVHDTVRTAVTHALQQDDSRRWGRRFPQENMHVIRQKAEGLSTIRRMDLIETGQDRGQRNPRLAPICRTVPAIPFESIQTTRCRPPHERPAWVVNAGFGPEATLGPDTFQRIEGHRPIPGYLHCVRIRRGSHPARSACRT